MKSIKQCIHQTFMHRGPDGKRKNRHTENKVKGGSNITSLKGRNTVVPEKRTKT